MEKLQTFLLLALLVGMAHTAVSEPIFKKKARAEAAESIKTDFIEKANTACGAEIKVEFDWESLDKNYDENHNEAAVAQFCGSVVEGIQALCEGVGEIAKASVQKKLKVVKCGYKRGLTTEEFPKDGLKLSGETLEANWDWNTGNLSEGTKHYLGNTLE